MEPPYAQRFANHSRNVEQWSQWSPYRNCFTAFLHVLLYVLNFCCT